MDGKRTTGIIVNDVYLPPNACNRCGKWKPPYKAAVPADVADQYCWDDCSLPDLETE